MAELTAHEQLLIELINRARLDPAGEAARYGVGLNEGLDAGTITAAPKQPLAPNSNLATAAQNHSQWMLDNDVFNHTGAGGSDPEDRMRGAGYTFTGSWNWGENISWRGTTGTLNLTTNIASHHEGLFESPGHRENILGDFREIGIGVRTGVYQGYNASMVTEDFAKTGTGQFVTGVAYFDANGDKFYSIGEGRGGVRMDARLLSSGVVTTINTASAGGYGVKLASGAYELTFSGGGITAAMGVAVSLGTLNIKVDVVAADGLATNVSATLTGAGKSLTLLGIENVNGTGNGQANQIFGNKGVNELDGAGGADTLSGGAGNDVFVVKAGEANGDLIADFSGNGGSPGDSIQFENYGAGATLQLISGNQWRIVGNGIVENITIVGAVAAGDYSFVGGGSPPAGLEPVTGTDGDDELVGTALPDVLGGGSGNDNEAGAAGGDWLYGGDGSDTLDGGTGIDSLRGGEGSDVYIVDSIYDFIQEMGGTADADCVWSALSIDLGNDSRFGGIEDARLLGTAAGSIIGDNRANCLAGNVAANAISGGADDDTLIGGDGNDTLDGGSGIDRLSGGKGNDVYFIDDLAEANDIVELGGEGIDTVRSTFSLTLAANIENLLLLDGAMSGEGNEIANNISGNSWGNELEGAAGNDTISGGGGDDEIDGGTGADLMSGGLGDDEYIVDLAGDKISEAASQGTDTVLSNVSWILGANLENLTLINAAALNGVGNALVNIIIGNASSNLLSGGAGNDTLQSDGGNDTLDGGAGADRMEGGSGDDTYVIDDLDTDGAGWDKGDVVSDSGGVDTVRSYFAVDLSADYPGIENAALLGTAAIAATGAASANWLSGNKAGNQLIGLAGNDTLDGGGGGDKMTGGTGDDRYVVDSVYDVITENGGEGTDTVQSTVSHVLGVNLENLVLAGIASVHGSGNGGANTITGNNAANRLAGLLGNDTLTGNGGNDLLDGGAGADSLDGGMGNDLFLIDSASDTVSERDGEGIDTVRSSLQATTLAAFVENLTLSTGAKDGTGNGLNNVISGNNDANILDGLGGNDTLTGAVGNDTIFGGAGIDRMGGGLGDDLYIVDSSTDLAIEASGQGVDAVTASASFTLGNYIENLTLAAGTGDINGTGNNQANIISGNEGANGLAGSAGNDTISGGIGADTLDGGAGNDSLSGGAGDDTFLINAAGDIVAESAGGGTDTVQSAISYKLGADVENLILLGKAAINGTGNGGDNLIVGNAAANGLDGGEGDDVLRGGAGNDTLTGSLGSDSFVRVSGSDGRDTIADFTLGAGGDRLDIGDVLVGYDSGDNAAEFVQLVVSNGNTIVRIDANGATGGAQFADAFVLMGVAVTDPAQLVSDGNLILQ
ncbi:MAG TPA: CAP domain-containing protein [Verrucomicrobiae bacterium]|nr:CAP domain-containing protein [Verrucomicrobiae bacterium]